MSLLSRRAERSRRKAFEQRFFDEIAPSGPPSPAGTIGFEYYSALRAMEVMGDFPRPATLKEKVQRHMLVVEFMKRQYESRGGRGITPQWWEVHAMDPMTLPSEAELDALATSDNSELAFWAQKCLFHGDAVRERRVPPSPEDAWNRLVRMEAESKSDHVIELLSSDRDSVGTGVIFGTRRGRPIVAITTDLVDVAACAQNESGELIKPYFWCPPEAVTWWQ